MLPGSVDGDVEESDPFANGSSVQNSNVRSPGMPNQSSMHYHNSTSAELLEQLVDEELSPQAGDLNSPDFLSVQEVHELRPGQQVLRIEHGDLSNHRSHVGSPREPRSHQSSPRSSLKLPQQSDQRLSSELKDLISDAVHDVFNDDSSSSFAQRLRREVREEMRRSALLAGAAPQPGNHREDHKNNHARFAFRKKRSATQDEVGKHGKRNDEEEHPWLTRHLRNFTAAQDEEEMATEATSSAPLTAIRRANTHDHEAMAARKKPALHKMHSQASTLSLDQHGSHKTYNLVISKVSEGRSRENSHSPCPEASRQATNKTDGTEQSVVPVNPSALEPVLPAAPPLLHVSETPSRISETSGQEASSSGLARLQRVANAVRLSQVFTRLAKSGSKEASGSRSDGHSQAHSQAERENVVVALSGASKETGHTNVEIHEYEQEDYDDYPMDSEDSSKTGIQRLIAKMHWFVRSMFFDVIVCVFLVLNALFIGLEVDLAARLGEENVPQYFDTIGLIFLIIFTLEIVMRISAHGCKFFYGPGWRWNLFDLAMLLLQFLDEIATLLSRQTIPLNVSFLRMLRALRLIRVIRLIRILRMIGELRTIIASIVGSLKFLGWTIVLFIGIIYMFAICLTQVVSESKNRDQAGLQEHYGDLGTSMSVLFQCLTGGVEWGEAMDPLVTYISDVFSYIFPLYIVFGVLALLNVVTGVFVETSLLSAKNDKDFFMVNNVRELFLNADSDSSGEITWESFVSQLDTPLMRNYFKAMDLDLSEARGLFKLLDMDDSGTVNAEEFLHGCLRFRGPAKALDIALIMREIRRMGRQIRDMKETVDYVQDAAEDDPGDPGSPLSEQRTSWATETDTVATERRSTLASVGSVAGMVDEEDGYQPAISLARSSNRMKTPKMESQPSIQGNSSRSISESLLQQVPLAPMFFNSQQQS